MHPEPTAFTSPRRSRAGRLAWIAVAFASIPLVAYSQTTQDVLTNLANQIAERRARVETLSDQVQQSREQYNEEVRSLSSQIADVEVQINRERLRLEQIEQDLETALAAIAAAEGAVPDLEPVLQQAFTDYQAYITSSLPFQVEDRLAELQTLERILADGNLEPQTVLTRLWNTLEGEFRLAEETGLFRQTINVDGEEQLAEVARVGMVFLYFRTFDDRFGYAVPDEDGNWSFQFAASREEAAALSELFEGLRRNLRQGFFTLPNPYREDL